jgi:L-ascorbate metabolism protein UlaG (beta-lactamase superfamily)
MLHHLLLPPFDVSRKNKIQISWAPVNGAIVQEAGQIHSGQPICMNPEQAVVAANVLKAAQIIPIHYDSFNNPPTYVETENITNRLKTASQEHQVKLLLL